MARKKKKVLVFASGTRDGGGSGFAELVKASLAGTLAADIVGVVSNHAVGGVRTRARDLDIPFFLFPPQGGADMYQHLAALSGADYFALSGWLRLVTGLDLKTRFNSRTVFNIHPGDPKKFGGKGMHGQHVHTAVMEAYWCGEIIHTAVCMHFVDAMYDHGPVFFRRNVKILPHDTPETLAHRVNQVEHQYQPMITNLVVTGEISWDGTDPGSLRVPAGYLVESYT